MQAQNYLKTSQGKEGIHLILWECWTRGSLCLILNTTWKHSEYTFKAPLDPLPVCLLSHQGLATPSPPHWTPPAEVTADSGGTPGRRGPPAGVHARRAS